jgi:hypothetical protein
MALSQDEQRILAEIERRLASDDPGLASSLTTFRRPGAGRVLRSPRVRIVGSLFTVLLVAMISMTLYAMIPFRAHLQRPATTPTAGAQVNTALSVASTQPPVHQSAASLSSGARSTASQAGSSRSTATGKPQTKAKATSSAMLPEASPVQGQAVPASP